MISSEIEKRRLEIIYYYRNKRNNQKNLGPPGGPPACTCSIILPEQVRNRINNDSELRE